MITKASLRMKRLLLGASALSGLTVATMPSALAQTAAADAPQDVVIVTGSRIARQDLQSSSPVNVVDDSDILLSGQVNLEAVLNELPAVAPDLTSTTNNGGTGIATVNLRALGPTARSFSSMDAVMSPLTTHSRSTSTTFLAH